jgi:glycosyltransferase involved in cell wall biosynthesis
LTIGSCIQSVLDQKYPNIEHIIVDGLSADGTLPIIKKYTSQYSHIKLISEKDKGIYDAMNKGLNLATGEWIYFMGSDDKFYDNDVLKELFIEQKTEEIDVLYGNVIFKRSKERYDGAFDIEKLYSKNISHQAIFARKTLFEKTGPFNLKYRSWADYEFNVKWLGNPEIKNKYIDKTVALYNDSGFSSKNIDVEFLKDKDSIFKKFTSLYFPKVSVIIPNYNHSKYLDKRIKSVLSQTFDDYEVILMDDKSNDSSVEVIKKYTSHPKIKKVLLNSINSGNTFIQWNKGINEAKGEYIWMAESDDYADEKFLSSLVEKIDCDKNIGLAYSQSFQVDQDDQITGSWITHTDDLDKERWKKDFINNGQREIEKYLLYKNTIPNASAVLFRKRTFTEVGGADPSIEKCGDWYLWLKILLHSDIAFVSKSLNYFRRHPKSVIATAEKPAYYYDGIMRKKLTWQMRAFSPDTKRVLALNKKLIFKDYFLLALWSIKRARITESLKSLGYALAYGTGIK